MYTSHFLLTISQDCLLLDASAGPMAGEGGKSSALPIHSRMAVPWSAARRLAAVLNTAIAQYDSQRAGNAPAVPPLTMPEAAQLPRLEV